MPLKPVYDPAKNARGKAQSNVSADYQQNSSSGVGLFRCYVEESREVESQNAACRKRQKPNQAKYEKQAAHYLVQTVTITSSAILGCKLYLSNTVSKIQ